MPPKAKPPVCQICDFVVNNTVHKQVSCEYCSFEACRKCCETYILGDTVPKCMNLACGREWSRKFLSKMFTSKFVKTTYKSHRENVIFEQEKALLPETQIVVERIIKLENLNSEISELGKQIKDLQRRQIALKIERDQLSSESPVTERREFVKACPDTACRGYLSTQWKCGLCEKWACPTCHEIKGDAKDAEHTCNPDIAATVALLANDSKNCPKCHASIYKISGCDQMWCTQCHTAFNWRTNRIENVVHNPHYFEWLRRNGNEVPRNPGDIPCQQHQITHHVSSDMMRLFQIHAGHWLAKTCRSFLDSLIMNSIHLRYVIVENYRAIDYAERNRTVRISYMRSMIDEKTFKSRIQMNEKRQQKSTETRNVLDILLNTITAIVFRFKDHLQTCPVNSFTLDILEEIDPIVEYANECLHEISETYSSVKLQFNNQLRMVSGPRNIMR